MLLAVPFLLVLDYGKAYNADLIRDVKSKLKHIYSNIFTNINLSTNTRKNKKFIHGIPSR